MSTHEAKPESPWSLFLTSLIIIGLTIAMYVMITNMEASGGSMRIHWLVALAYMFLGKWGVVGIGTLISFGTFFQGAARLVRKRN